MQPLGTGNSIGAPAAGLILACRLSDSISRAGTLTGFARSAGGENWRETRFL
ncbi:hypothetical protein [Kamptonema formosum]|uniref:hypothetical protein n=1 Tax=Kamptonema formosum TaxID=331992 RepID=UPI0012DFE6F0|nr:hypothetical protein [Oscillatoria sp. PCC 10802]